MSPREKLHNGVLYLPHKPIGDQLNYFNLSTRFTVGVIGRQYGKSTLAMVRRVKKMIEKSSSLSWWVSPVVSQAKVQFKRFIKHYSHLIDRLNKTDLEIEIFNKSIIQFKGSDDYENLKGDTLDDATLDECGTMHKEVFHEVIQPMLAVKNGGADLIGTPKGKNWFYSIWANALNDAQWSRHHASSDKSPFFTQEEFEKLRASMSEAHFRQEILAEFIDNGSEVFSNYRECIKGELEEPRYGVRYVAGVDLAKYADWTVITIWDYHRKHLVYYARFNNIDWSIQEERIVAAVTRYNKAKVKIDATGVGDPVYERLRKRGIDVDPVRITAPIKEDLIQGLVFAIEKREITFPYIDEMLHEFSVFNIERTKTGNIRYTAQSGHHDDIVMSMALAVQGLTNFGYVPQFRDLSV